MDKLVYSDEGVIYNTPGAWSQRARLTENSWEAALWSPEGQIERFEFVSKILQPELHPGDSLLDYGCGFGSFSMWVPADVKYTGYDFSYYMIQRAQERYSAPWRRFFTTEIGQAFDHVVIIGTFNLKHNWSKEQTRAVLRRLVEKTKKTIVGSFYAGEDDRCISYAQHDFTEFNATFLKPRYNDLVVVIDQ